MNPILLATLAALLYGVLLFGLVKLFGVKYTEITRDTKSIIRGIVLPVGIASVVLVAVSIYTGWLMPSFSYVAEYRNMWLWTIPAAMLVGIVVRFTHARWRTFERRGMLYLILGTLLVGLSEELLARGIFVHLFTLAGMPQYIVMLGTSILFGLLHGMNYFNGQARRTTISQMFVSALTGMGLYLTLVVSGSLLLPIVLHWLFDLSLLAQGPTTATRPRTPGKLELLAALTFYAATLIALLILFVNGLVA